MNDEPMTLSPDERAAARVFLQRSEVRLSTLHRTATALLSGAGVLVMLPAVSRDTVVTVLQGLLADGAGPMSWSLAAMAVSTLALALVMIWLLLKELARFYFHSNHVTSESGTTFTPRFTLTTLRLPRDELGTAGTELIERLRSDPDHIELLVPANEGARRSIDTQIAAYSGLAGAERGDDQGRAVALSQLAGARDRDLLSEVVKIEFGMVRHVIRVQVIVLRYVKALLAVIATLLSTFVMAEAVSSSQRVDNSVKQWILGTILVWCPTVLFVVSAPVRWLGQLLMSEGATAMGIRYDPDLTRLERVASWFSSVVLVAAVAATIVMAVIAERTSDGAPLLLMALGAVIAHLSIMLRTWRSAGGATRQ